MNDVLIRGLGLEGRARVIVARTTDTAEELRRIHDPSPEVAAALGRLATGALLVASSLEKVTAREPVVTVEVHGDGPAGRLVATASPAGWVRAFAANAKATAPPRPDGKLGVAGVVGSTGKLLLTRDPGYGEPYRGVVPLFCGEIAEDLAFYLSESEQTPSAVALGVFASSDGCVSHAGGILVQLLPGVSDDEAVAIQTRMAEVGPVTSALQDGKGPEDWLAHVFPNTFEELGRLPVSFRCGCSEDRVEAVLKLLGAAEIESMLADASGKPENVHCEFCHRGYEVTPAQLKRLLAEVRAETEVQ